MHLVTTHTQRLSKRSLAGDLVFVFVVTFINYLMACKLHDCLHLVTGLRLLGSCHLDAQQ